MTLELGDVTRGGFYPVLNGNTTIGWLYRHRQLGGGEFTRFISREEYEGMHKPIKIGELTEELNDLKRKVDSLARLTARLRK